MSFPEDTIQLCSVIVAGIASQVLSNFRCGLMILTNIIVLIGAVLVSSKLRSRETSIAHTKSFSVNDLTQMFMGILAPFIVSCKSKSALSVCYMPSSSICQHNPVYHVH